MVTDLVAGRYRPIDRHAIGGMASVWRARDERTGELVALKRIHPHLMADPTARARLDREAAALRLVDHPAVVRPRDLIDDPDDPALVMDFAEGRPLSERIAEGPLPTDEAVAIARTVADALGVAHGLGVVHRDVKPDNILIEDDGTLHLIDFGIASLDAEGAALTDARSMVGTLRYAAPERLAGEPASARSDVWALGAVLYEMLTGRPAVTPLSAGPAATPAGARTAPPDLATLPPAVATVIARAMAVDPVARYPDGAAFRDALDGLDAPVDPEAATALIPLAAAPSVPTASGIALALRSWRTPLLGGVLALALLVVIAATGPASRIGSGPAGVVSGPSGSVGPVLASPSLVPASAPSIVPLNADHAKGRGNGNGKGKR